MHLQGHAVLPEHPGELRLHRVVVLVLVRLGREQKAAPGVRDGQRVAVLHVPHSELALVVGAPHMVALLGIEDREDRLYPSPPFLRVDQPVPF